MPTLLLLLTTLSASTEKPVELTLEDLRAFTEVFAHVQGLYVQETSDHTLFENAIRGMLSGLDDHTVFLDREAFKAMTEDTSGEYGGVGIQVLWVDDALTITELTPEGPADQAGLARNDVIVAVDGEAIAGMDRAVAMAAVRGAPGTPVTLTIARDTWPEPREVVLTREAIAVDSVFGRLYPGQIAYLKIVTFQVDTDAEARDTLRALREEAGGRLAGVVLDLRGNAGGVVSAAAGLSDMFLHDGLIVSSQGRGPGAGFRFRAHPGDLADGAPVVVIVDDMSASASEIVAGALQDHGRALILGRVTYGKGSVQTILPLSNGTGLKITTARYYTPTGRSIQPHGITPDIVIEPGEGSEVIDYALDRALEELRAGTVVGRAAEQR